MASRFSIMNSGFVSSLCSSPNKSPLLLSPFQIQGYSNQNLAYSVPKLLVATVYYTSAKYYGRRLKHGSLRRILGQFEPLGSASNACTPRAWVTCLLFTINDYL
jgi:hypothetical protein